MNIAKFLITPILKNISPNSCFCKLQALPPSRLTFRSSRPEVFCKKGALRNFTKVTGKHLCQSFFFNKVADLWPATLLKKETLVQVFSCEISEIFKNTYHYRTPLVAASEPFIYFYVMCSLLL